jgi:hypothetical protein
MAEADVGLSGSPVGSLWGIPTRSLEVDER